MFKGSLISHPSDNTLLIKSKYYEYLFQILKRINYDAYNTGSTQPLITQKAISNIEIPLPSSDELDKFEKISSTLYSEVYKNNKEIEKLTKLINSSFVRIDHKEAMKLVAKDRGVSKRDIYQHLVK